MEKKKHLTVKLYPNIERRYKNGYDNGIQAILE